MNSKLSQFITGIARIFKPPFYGLSLVMWCYFVFSYIALPHNPVWSGALPDPDDYTYLTQTLDWLQGQGWYDNIQHRMNAPEGVPIHYTRFAEIPIAAIILFFRSFHYSWHGAALLGSFLLPVIYLAAFFCALRFAAARFINPDWARLTSFIAMFAPVLMFKFAPGQVDHHGIEAALTILATGLTAQFFANPHQLRIAAASGFVFALALAIALETLPWMALAAAVIGLWCAVSGREASRATIAYALSLFLSSAFFLVIDKPPADLATPDLLSYSIAYVILTGGIALALLTPAAVSRLALFPRLILSACIALILAALYLHHFPNLLAGPYGAMDKKLAALFFANLEEAEPMHARYGFYKSLLLLFPSLLGLSAALFFLRTAPRERKAQWLLLASLAAAAIAFAYLYQIRMLIYASLFSFIPLAAFAEHAFLALSTRPPTRARYWSEIALVLLVGPLTAILLPALQDSRSFNTGIVLFPAQNFDNSCDMHTLTQLLTSPAYATRAPLRIVNMIDQGPQLLFDTPHQILSAPYHMNVTGNLDALDFFSTTDADHAEQIARRDGINLVVLCRDIPDMYLHGSAPHYAILPNREIHMLPDDSLAGRLAFHNPPAWLTEVSVPQPSNYLVFEVQ